MRGHKFKDLKKQRIVTIENVEGSMAVLNNGEKIAVERLLNLSYFTPYSNTSQSSSQPILENNSVVQSNNSSNNTFDSTDRYQYLVNNMDRSISIGEEDAGNMRNVPTDTRFIQNSSIAEDLNNPVMERHVNREEDTGGGMIVEQSKKPQPRSTDIGRATAGDFGTNKRNTPQPKQNLSKEEQLIEKYKNNSAKKVNPTLEKLAGETVEENEAKPGSLEDIINNSPQPSEKEVNEVVVVEDVNPLKSMFDKAKKTHSVKLNLDINEKIPDKNIIKMFEENFDDSAIEYYAKEILIKIMSDPNKLEKQIKDEIKKICSI